MKIYVLVVLNSNGDEDDTLLYPFLSRDAADRACKRWARICDVGEGACVREIETADARDDWSFPVLDEIESEIKSDFAKGVVLNDPDDFKDLVNPDALVNLRKAYHATDYYHDPNEM